MLVALCAGDAVTGEGPPDVADREPVGAGFLEVDRVVCSSVAVQLLCVGSLVKGQGWCDRQGESRTPDMVS
jgi:hypothetical protein